MSSSLPDIFAAADKAGLGLTEYLQKNYNEKQIAELESGIRDKLDSLRSEIDFFMREIDVPDIRYNLLSISNHKLDKMQKKIKANMQIKELQLNRIERETSASIESFESHIRHENAAEKTTAKI